MQVCDDKLGSCHWSSDSFDFEFYFCVRVNLLLPWLQTHRSRKHNQTTAGTAINSRAPRAYEQSPIAKKMCLLFHFHPMNFGSHVTVRTFTLPSAPEGNQCESSHFLATVRAWNLILHIHVLVNWQLSKQGVRWPVSHNYIAGSGVDPSMLHVFFEIIHWRVSSFQMIVGSTPNIFLQWLQVIGWSKWIIYYDKFINENFAFSLA